MKDILKMTSKERDSYLNNIDIDKELDKVIGYRITLDNKLPVSVTQLVRKNYKLFFGTNKQPKSYVEKFNHLLIHLSVFISLDVYEDYIKGSDSE